MEIRTFNKIERKKIQELEMMRMYLIFNDETKDNEIIITNQNKVATLISKASNCKEMVITLMGRGVEVNVVGQITDFDMINLKFEYGGD